MREKADEDEVELGVLQWVLQWVLQLGTKVQVTVAKMMYIQQLWSFIRFCSLCWGVPPEVVSVHQ